MIKDLEALVSRLKRSRLQLYGSIANLNEAQMNVPIPGGEWSIKDHLAHLAANEALMTELAECIATGQSTRLGADFDNDKFNAESVAARRGKSTNEIMDELAASREKLNAFLESVTPEQLSKRGEHPLAGWLTIKEFLVVINAHELTHAREIEDHARRLRMPSK